MADRDESPESEESAELDVADATPEQLIEISRIVYESPLNTALGFILALLNEVTTRYEAELATKH